MKNPLSLNTDISQPTTTSQTQVSNVINTDAKAISHIKENCMDKQVEVKKSSDIDFNALRIPANYGATLGVKKLLTNVPVGKPKKANFFRCHPADDMTYPTMLLEQKESNESYLVVPEVAQEISELVRRVEMFTAIDRHNNVLLIPVPLPGDDGNRNPWHESLAQAVELSKENWIRISANMRLGCYDVFVAEATLSEPEWPEYSMKTILEVAFRGKIITSLEHPIVQSLLGRI